MKRWGIAAVVAAGLVLTGCGSGPDPEAEATVRACHLLASAEDNLADALNGWVAAGKPQTAGAARQAVTDAVSAYPALISQAATESQGATIASSLQKAASNADLVAISVSTGGSSPKWAIDAAVQECRDAGVEMTISTLNG